MQKFRFIYILMATILVGLQACRTKCDQTLYYVAKVPVYENLTAIRNSIKFTQARTIDHVDQIVESNNAYFLLEKNTGIHIIDKSSSPNILKIGFIEIPSCFEISIVGSYLVVTQASDIVTLDVSGLNQVTEKSRLKNVLNTEYVLNDSFVVSYDTAEVVKIIEDATCGGDYYYETDIAPNEVAIPPHAAMVSQKGSCFISDNHNLISVRVDSTTGVLQFGTSQPISFNPIEFPHIAISSDLIIVGKPNNGLFGFTISNSTLTPTRATFGIQSVNTCGKFYVINNHLFFPDFSENIDINRCFPNGSLFIRKIRTNEGFMNLAPQFAEARHISTDKNIALLSDGTSGFALLNVSNPQTFNFTNDLLGSIGNISANISLHSKGKALVWGNDGLFLFDVTNPSDIVLLKKVE